VIRSHPGIETTGRHRGQGESRSNGVLSSWAPTGDLIFDWFREWAQSGVFQTVEV